MSSVILEGKKKIKRIWQSSDSGGKAETTTLSSACIIFSFYSVHKPKFYALVTCASVAVLVVRQKEAARARPMFNIIVIISRGPKFLTGNCNGKINSIHYSLCNWIYFLLKQLCWNIRMSLQIALLSSLLCCLDTDQCQYHMLQQDIKNLHLLEAKMSCTFTYLWFN